MTRIADSAEIVYIGYVGGLGGEGRQIFTLATGTAQAGRRTHLILPDLPKVRELAAQFPATAGLTVELTSLIQFDTGAQNPANVLRLLLPHRNAPILHLHTGDICLPRLTCLGLAVLHAPRAGATIHCPHAEMAPESARARFWAGFARRHLRFVVSPSHGGRRTQLAYGVPEEKAVTIHNGVDTAKYAGGDGIKARRSIGLDAKTPLVVYAARLYPQKRPLDAVRVFEKTARTLPDAHFAFIGSGPMDEEVAAALRGFPAPERLHRLPQQDNIPDWLAASDVWLFPTEAENLSLALAEAAAAGCAIVTTQCAGNDEIITDGESGFLLPVGDADGMAGAIIRLLQKDGSGKRLRDGARRASVNFTRERMTEGHLRLYDRVTRRK